MGLQPFRMIWFGYGTVLLLTRRGRTYIYTRGWLNTSVSRLFPIYPLLTAALLVRGAPQTTLPVSERLPRDSSGPIRDANHSARSCAGSARDGWGRLSGSRRGSRER